MATQKAARDPKSMPEPIAIVGMACRFPGADGADEFWKLLREGVNAISEVPPERWDADAFYSSTPGAPGKMVTRWGGFLKNVDRFDAAFFRISPREAMRMDPQQRLLLEVAWEALEDAGQVPKEQAGTSTGVFIGLSSSDYGRVQADLNESDAYIPTGNAASIAANRISFFFDYQGPSIVVDTACSSALVALHLACRSIWSGESSLGLAGGVNVILSPGNTINFSQAGMMSPDGQCKAFDERANGYVRGEGAGIVVLKLLSHAERDGDRIYALIRGSAVNQDGHTSGLTVPSQAAQERVTQEACSHAGVSPGQIDYVEAHGTGTSVGDPIEARALGRALAAGREPGSICTIGSCKTNIGHLESAAGIAGVIKVALALAHREIPPSLHFQVPNPHIPFDELPVRVQKELSPWPERGRPSLAGVNSFGFGGTNAHVILEQYVAARGEARAESGQGIKIFPLSAESSEGLKVAALDCARALISPRHDGSDSLHDLCYTASVRRTHHEHRLAVIARTREELTDRLTAFLAEESRPGWYVGRAMSNRPGKLAFVFPGQGSQWWGMGRALLEREATFRNAIAECDALFRRHVSWSLVDELKADERTSRLNETEIAQPALFALQVGLAALWRSRGVMPDSVVGHSMGEVAAVHVAGVLSLSDAADVVFHRSRLMQQATGNGKMAAVELSLEEAEQALRGYEDRVSIAAANSPTSVVLSGEYDALEELLQALHGRDIFFRYLPVNYAFHSHQMDPYLGELESELRGLSVHTPSIPVFSTVIGGPLETGVSFGAAYWVKNVRQTVRFSDAVAALLDDGHRLFVELSPHPTLSGVIGQSLKEAGCEGTFIPSLRRGEDDEVVLAGGLGALYVSGFDVDWRRFFPQGGRCVSLPAYPWNRERHWSDLKEDDVRLPAWSGKNHAHKHPLVGKRLESAHPTWHNQLSGDRLAYLRDHQIEDSAVVPAAAYIEMGLAAGREVLGGAATILTDVVLQKPLLLAPAESTLVEITVSADSSDSASFQVSSREASSEGDNRSWVLHASGRVRNHVDSDGPPPNVGVIANIRERCPLEIPVGELYERLAQNGLRYGPCFRGIQKIWRGSGEALALVQVPAALEADLPRYQLHPALLDSCFQALGGAIDVGGDRSPHLYLPVAIGRVRAHSKPGAAVWCHVRLLRRPDQMKAVLEADVQLLGDDAMVLVDVSGLRLQLVDGDSRPHGRKPRAEERFYQMAWQSKPRPGQSPAHVSPEALPTPSELQRHLEKQLVRLTALKGLDRYDFDKLERWGNVQIVLAFRQLGWEPRVGDRFTREELQGRLGIVGEHSRLFQRLLSRLEEAGVLEAVDGQLSVSRVLEEDDRKMHDELLAAYPGAMLDLQLQRRCGSSLAAVLRGACDPLQVIFPDGSLAAAERFYEDSRFVSIFSRLIQEAVSAALGRLSPGATLRILELGAGTGGTTAHILSKLPREAVEYVYTDVSPVFTSHGAQKFAAYPFCRFQLLDIETDPLQQGFAPHSFDVIIASYVLHATIDLRRSLAHVQTLLADRGLLLLGEITGPTALYDMVFALTGGWWRFEDFDLRPSYPLLANEDWLRVFSEQGFTSAIAVPGDGRLRSRQTLLVAQGAQVTALDPPARVESVPPEQGGWIVFGEGGPLVIELVARLRANGQRCLEVTPGERYLRLNADNVRIDATRPEDFRQVITESLQETAPPRGVIYAWGLDEIGSPKPESIGHSLDVCAGGALYLTQALASGGGASSRLWFVTRGVAPVADEVMAASVVQATLWGVARVLTNEHPELRCTAIDLSRQSTSAEIQSLLEELHVDDREREIALRGSARYVHRAGPYSARRRGETRLTPSEGSFRLEVSRPGMLDSIVLRETERRDPARGEVAIRVTAAGLNFLDVLAALGLRPDRPAHGAVTDMGMECAGKVIALGEGVDHVQVGDDVIAVAFSSLSNYVLAHAPFVVRRPSGLSDEEAATIPAAFLTAHYALHHLGRIRKGERVLIHAAAGGVGLAAVQLARRAGAEIYATAGSAAKREYLRALGLQHVMDSRSLAFADEIRERTDGAGVDLVLNSLAGDAIPRSLSLLKSNGRFLEIGKKDVYQNSQLGLGGLGNNRSFHAIDLIPLFADQPDFSGDMLRGIVSLFEAGELRPLPHHAFPIGEAEEAFRYMAQARQIGKVVITVEDQPVSVAPARPSTLELSSDATYLVTGGLGGFGSLVAEWMVERGARHLVLMGRRGPQSEEALRALKKMEEAGARVTIATADVINKKEVEDVVRRIQVAMPPLRGVVHAAMVLEDSSVLQLSLASLKNVLAPKLVGAWNLHETTLGQPLDFFVLFGSMAALVGSPGQANYVAANAALDTLAHYRRSLGLPAIAIDWGRLGNVGYVARHEAIGSRLDGLGIKPMAPRQALDALEQVILENPVQVAVVDADWRATRRLIDTPLLSALLPESSGAITQEAAHSLRAALLAIDSGQRPAAIETYIQNELSRVLRLDPSRIDPEKRLTSLGLDSLMAYELKARIESDLGVGLPMVKLVGGPSISELAAYLASQVDPGSTSSATATRAGLSSVTEPRADAEITTTPEDLSDDGGESLLGIAGTLIPMNVSELNAEAVLDPAIRCEAPLPVAPTPSRIFLTGATGFLGAFLLHELLEQSHANISCLVRASTPAEGALRIRRNLESYSLWSDRFTSRITPVPGNLAEPFLGLGPSEFATLAADIDVIYHSAALVKFFRPYTELKAVNVGGTHEILRLASRGKPKRLHHVSSVAIFPIDGGKVHLESEAIDHGASLFGGYAQSKWVAEKLVALARSQGLPITVYRPGTITGHSNTGKFSEESYLSSLIRGCIELGSAPDTNAPMDMVPVDFVAKAIVNLSMRPESERGVFHLTNPEPIPMNRLVDFMRSFGFAVRRMPFQAWKRELLASSARFERNALYPFGAFIAQYEEGPMSAPRYDCRGTIEALASTSIVCPKMDDDLLSVYFSHFVNSGFVELIQR